MKKTEYELRAKNRRAGAGREIILDELDAKIQQAGLNLLLSGDKPEDWIAHDRGTRDVERATTTVFIEHLKIGLCITFEIADDCGAKLPDEVINCAGIEGGCAACLQKGDE
jgi:hypothetical protein